MLGIGIYSKFFQFACTNRRTVETSWFFQNCHNLVLCCLNSPGRLSFAKRHQGYSKSSWTGRGWPFGCCKSPRLYNHIQSHVLINWWYPSSASIFIAIPYCSLLLKLPYLCRKLGLPTTKGFLHKSLGSTAPFGRGLWEFSTKRNLRKLGMIERCQLFLGAYFSSSMLNLRIINCIIYHIL